MWTITDFICAQGVNGFSQVTALTLACAAAAIPSISLPAHRLAAFLHKSSTASCTGKVSQQGPCRASRAAGGATRRCFATPLRREPDGKAVTAPPLTVGLHGRG